ncbi:MAG: T9SS type A sorting domain-containing protein [candidate division Zixibacteria bacterium]|nr:T9SS type A sorting domain-containing protein [candidate division Zixibacteria bacterium]
MKSFRTIIIVMTLCAACTMAAITARSQPYAGDTLWTRVYCGDRKEIARSICETSTKGDYIIAGYTNSSVASCGEDGYLLRIDADGDTVWSHTYGGALDDRFYFIHPTNDGRFLISGCTSSEGDPCGDAYAVLVDSDGSIIWDKSFDKGNQNYDSFKCGIPADSGGFIFCGWTYVGVNVITGTKTHVNRFDYDPLLSRTNSNCDILSIQNRNIFLVRTDANGDTLWTRMYGGPGFDSAPTIKQTPDGGFIVAVILSEFDSHMNAGLMKIDANGDILWIRTYGGLGRDEGYCVQPTSDGGYILSGCKADVEPPYRSNGYLVKTNAIGDTLWTLILGHITPPSNYIYWIIETSDGGYAFAGLGGTTRDSLHTSGNVFIGKVDSIGRLLWTRKYGIPGMDKATQIQSVDEGYLVVATKGFMDNDSTGDFWILMIEDENSQLSVEMDPDNPPIIVPAGSSFTYAGTISNLTEDPLITDLWIFMRTPNGNMYGPIELWEGIPLEQNEVRVYSGLTQNIPLDAIVGSYSYISYVGNYPSIVLDASTFEFTVVEPLGEGTDNWNLSGLGFFNAQSDILPQVTTLLNSYPNPFNATTGIPFDLAQSGNVSLKVYNLSGQLVETLVDGQMSAGSHIINWDASVVSSGIYFYKLTAGNYVTTKKMNLLK